MKFFEWSKDGGPDSTVDGFFFIESKKFGSIALLRFRNGSREAFHSHAFNCWNIVLHGSMMEQIWSKWAKKTIKLAFWKPFRPFVIKRDRMHLVSSIGTSWLLTFRGPWKDTWEEYLPHEDRVVTLTHGRKEVCHH